MAAILRLTTGVVYVRSWSGTFSGTDLTLTGKLLLPDGTVAAPALAFASEPGLGFYRSGAAKLVVGIVGAPWVLFDGSITIPSNSSYNFSDAASNALSTADLKLTRESAAVLQMGLDAAGVTDQMLKGPDRITSDGVGGNLTIAGGRNRGASAGGSVLTSTSPAAGAGVTGTLAVRTIVDTTGAFTVGSTALTGAGALYAGSFYVGTTAGVSASVTTTALVGKTLTFVNGICTGFA